MWKYVAKKILLALPVLLGITLIDYLIMCLAGSPLDMMISPRATQEAVAMKAQQLGLDQPVLVRYLSWLGQLFQGNLGYSYKSYQPVAEMIGSQMAPTLLLMGVSPGAGVAHCGACGHLPRHYAGLQKRWLLPWFRAAFFGSSIPWLFPGTDLDLCLGTFPPGMVALQRYVYASARAVISGMWFAT